MQISPKYHHCKTLVQIRCHKGAGTKMHKGLWRDKNRIASLLKGVETTPPKKKERNISMIIISITMPTKIKNLVNKCTTVTNIMFSSR